MITFLPFGDMGCGSTLSKQSLSELLFGKFDTLVVSQSCKIDHCLLGEVYNFNCLSDLLAIFHCNIELTTSMR